MIDQADERLKDWAGGVVANVEIALSIPRAGESWRGISLYLLELVQRAPPRTTRRPPLQLWLRYLVTTWSDRPEDAHRMLSDLVFAAMEHSDFDVETDPIGVALWNALGLPPRPAFVLGMPLRRERPEPAGVLVRRPLVVKSSPLEPFHGVILGPGDVPLAAARVHIPALRLHAESDARGRFAFPAVPADPREKLLVVKARGREVSVSTAEPHREARQPLIVRFDMPEE
jgi:hypothetical protein